MRYFYLYETTDTTNGKTYVGVHETENLDDGYLGSGLLLRRAIRKRGKDAFRKKILEFFNCREAMYARERELVDHTSKSTYNVSPGGLGTSITVNRKAFRGPHTLEAKNAIRKARIGTKHTDESRAKMSANNFALKDPDRHRAHARAIASRPKSEEHRRRISESLKEQKQKIIECPKCGKSGGERAMKRWHFEKCRVGCDGEHERL